MFGSILFHVCNFPSLSADAKGTLKIQHCTLRNVIKLQRETDLDPREEDHDGDGAVEDDLPVTEELKVGVLLRPTEQVLQLVDDGEGAVDVEDDAAAGEEDDDDVEDVPEALEVRHAVLLDLTTRHGIT